MSFIPIVRDILPIILPNLGVQVTKSTDLDVGTGQTEGMVRKAAVVHKSQHLCASVMIAHAHTASAVHHHGEQDTIVYAASGRGVILSNNGKHRHVLEAGDFAFIPAWTEHQEVNDGDEEVTWIITRSGPSPIVVNLKGWGGPEMKS